MTMTLDGTHRRMDRILPAGFLPLAFGLGTTWVIWMHASALSTDARIVLIVVVLAAIGWIATPLPDSLVALIAALSLVVTGAQPQEALTQTLSAQIVWLLLAAFVIAAVIKEAGLAERLVAPLTRSAPRLLPFMLMVAAAISATAFLLPSTSGRAALLLPVYLGLLSSLPDKRLARPLALLFPTAILLSAGGSLIGAGAHVVAVEAIASVDGPRLGYLDWLLLGGPLALASVTMATLLIFALFVPRDLWSARILPSRASSGLTPLQTRILMVLCALVAFWIAKPLHGIGEPVVALGGAVLLLMPPFCARKPKEVFRSVDVELVLYMAATLMLSVAVIDTGLDTWLASGAMALLPAEMTGHTGAVIMFLSVVAVASHLAITSRSARASILIPALALPLAGLGHDATLAILIAVMGTGFCQTMMASAKPVALFGLNEQAGFTQKDLFRLSLPLAPLKIALLAGFAVWVWPIQIESLAQGKPSAQVAYEPLTADMRIAIAAMPNEIAAFATATSLRPKTRPASLRIAAERRQAATPATRRIPEIAIQLRQDLRRAGSDIRTAGKTLERNLSRLFR